MVRFAKVTCDSAKALWAYLPDNYVILSGVDPVYLIGGVDVAGWTLDDYVLPRLASGLYSGHELTEEEAIEFVREQRR